MMLRKAGRWLSMVAIGWAAAGAVASCGSGGGQNNSFLPQAGDDASVEGGYGDATTGDDGGSGTFETDSGASDSGGGGGACIPKTCAQLGYTCGPNSDGCGHLIDCGMCTAPQYCGGGGYSVCGGNGGVLPDGAPPCTPTTCAQLGYTCGFAGDGCGGTLMCGACTDPQFCGGAGFDKCGGNNGLQSDGGVPCTPVTCALLGYTCGPAGDGCGGLLQCGSCSTPQYCGGGGPSKCGGNTGSAPDGGPLCTPLTCQQLGYDCGYAGDGCGGQVQCGTCTSPQYCGGGGFDKCGGNNGLQQDGAVPCTPATCASLGYDCGYAGDGCGGLLSCGTCTSPQYCGGGGYDVCGGSNGVGSDGGVLCTPKTCAQLGYDCGYAADGCGGQLFCGTCTNPQYCGGGGYDVCGGNNGLQQDGGVPCTPKTCAQLGYDCGYAGDGCGNQLFCGACTDPQYCGGGGFDVCGGNNGLSQDGGVACTPKTCAQLGYTCGYAGDGCGGSLFCGTCTSPQYCGGGGFDVCGPTSVGGCGGGTTILSGYVYDPGDNLPVYNALVYVPVGSVQTPQTGVVPAQCGCSAPAAYASAYTAIDGSFTLTNPPSGSSVTVVVQLGKWQRIFHLPVTACVTNTLSSHLTLPSTKSEGNIPRFAVDTGDVDAMECVLLKMGIAQSEFTDPDVVGGTPTGSGRIHLYQGAITDYYDPTYGTYVSGGGAVIDGNTPDEFTLLDTASVLDSYDVVLFPCQGDAATDGYGGYSATDLSNVLDYANVGGRAFTTHFHYDLLQGNGSFGGTANWVTDSNYLNSTTGYIDTSFTRGQTLAAWLNQSVVYGGTYGQIPVDVVRQDFTSVNAPAQLWMYASSTYPIHYTFDTPFNQSPTCGRVVYSDFHVEEPIVNYDWGYTFPSECASGGLTPQEKLLEFMLFDLTSCVSQPTCTPVTCAQQGIACGYAGDGCGGQLFCGTCVSPQTCGGGGVPGQCGYPDAGSCAPLTCAQQNIACGYAGDGCGGQLYCGTCTAPQTCGGGGVPGQCGYPDGGSCTKLTCAQQNIACGYAGDGCGGQLYCGTCMAPQTCGGGGVPGQCGYPDGGSCTKLTCAQQNIDCGPAGDGCGGFLNCGTCVSPQTCGGGGVPGQCGYPDGGSCTPQTCQQQNINCGPAGNGCGGQLDCGTCTPPQTCGGGGVPGQCGGGDGGSCAALTCAQQNINCGPAGDGCGGQLDCGTCTPPATCGGGGVPGQCGYPDAGSCTPQTCQQQNINCGPAGDGCGNEIMCGTCTAPDTCGGGGVPGQCGYLDGGACTPETCQQLNIRCGPAGNGCGGLLQCGTCTAPQTCGGGGMPGQCGGGTQ